MNNNNLFEYIFGRTYDPIDLTMIRLSLLDFNTKLTSVGDMEQAYTPCTFAQCIIETLLRREFTSS